MDVIQFGQQKYKRDSLRNFLIDSRNQVVQKRVDGYDELWLALLDESKQALVDKGANNFLYS